MLLRAVFLLALAFPASTFAEADNCPVKLFEPIRAAKDKIQGLVGGARGCTSMNMKDVKTFECRTNVKNVGRALTTADDLNGIAVGMFFQSLASNSHKQVICRLGALDKYSSDPAAKAQMHAKAEHAFNKIHAQLKQKVEERNKLQANLNRMNTDAAADRAMSAMTYKGRQQHQKSIDKITEDIARLLTTIPFGYDPDVGRSLIQMSLGPKFDAGLFEQGVQNAVPKYEDTSKYYESKWTQTSKDRGTYCLGLDYRNLAGKSGQINQWLQSLPNGTAADRSYKQKLSCRLDAHYETGNERFANGVMIAGFATYLLPPAWIPRAGGAVIGAAELVARGAAGVVAVLSMDAMRAQCFPPRGAISGEAKCDPDKEFAHVLEESDQTKCAGIALMSASVVGEARGVAMAVKAARAQKSTAKSTKIAVAPKAAAPPASASEIGAALGKSDKFKFYKAEQGETAITRETFTPDKSYVVLVHDGKILIGENFLGGGGKTAGTHFALRQAATGIPKTNLTAAPGGSMRVNKDGSIDVSAYYQKGRDKAGALLARMAMVDGIKAAIPGVKIRATVDRLNTIETTGKYY